MVPIPRTSAARTSAYASTTHCRDENDVLRSPAISGRATFTMVTSTRSMNVPRLTVIRGNHLRITPVCPWGTTTNFFTCALTVINSQLWALWHANLTVDHRY